MISFLKKTDLVCVGIHRSRVTMDLQLDESRFQCTLQGTGLGKGDKGDELLLMQRVPPLHVTDVVQGKGKGPYNLATVPSQEFAERCRRTLQVLQMPIYMTVQDVVTYQDIPSRKPFVMLFSHQHSGFVQLVVGCAREPELQQWKDRIMDTHGADTTFYEIKHKSCHLIVVAENIGERYIFLNLRGEFLCVCIKPDTAEEQIAWLVKSISDDSVTAGSLVCLSSNRQISISDLCALPNLSTVCFIKRKPVYWTFHYKCTAAEYKYTVKGSNVDSVFRMKQRFLRVVSTEQGMELDNTSDNIWLIYKHMVLTDAVLQKVFGLSFAWPRVMNTVVPYNGFYKIPVRSDRLLTTEKSVLKVDVDFKPVDAIPKTVLVKKDSEAWVQKALVVLSPDITPGQLRVEISKALQKKQGALQIKVGAKALEDVTNLQEQLHGTSCDISIKICLTKALIFKIIRQPSGDIVEEVLHFYPFDTVLEVKSELSTLLNVPNHKIDVFYQGQTLREEQSIHNCYSKEKIEFTVVVYENRIRLQLHILGSTNSHISALVDDRERTTIWELKQFTKNTKTAYSLLPDSEIMVIFQNHVFCDTDTLSEAGISPEMEKQRIVLKHCSSLCFNATSAALDGTFITFQDDGQGSFTHILTMTNGQELFAANKLFSEEDRRMLLTQRKTAASAKPIKGIRVWTGDLAGEHTEKMRRPRHGSVSTITPQSQRSNVESVSVSTESLTNERSTEENAHFPVVSTMTGTMEDDSDEATAQPQTANTEGSGARTLGAYEAGSNNASTSSASYVANSTEISEIITKENASYEYECMKVEIEDILNMICSFDNAEATAQPLTVSAEDNAARIREAFVEAGSQNSSISRAARFVSGEIRTDENAASEGSALGKTERRDDQLHRQTLYGDKNEPAMQLQKAGCKRNEARFTEMSEEPGPSTSYGGAQKRPKEETTSDSEPLSESKKRHSSVTVSKRRKSMAKTTLIEESMEESETDKEMWDCQKKITINFSLRGKAVEEAQRRLLGPTPPAYSLSAFSQTCAPHLMNFTSEDQTPWQNAKFKYIDKEVILAVAKELGTSGSLVITHLGVPRPIIQEAEGKHGLCSVRSHLECLITWCEREGSNANPYNLKKALAANDRNDLVQVVEDILSSKTGYNPLKLAVEKRGGE